MTWNTMDADDYADLRDIFAQFDEDESGNIEVSELRNLLDALGARMSDEEVDAATGALDTDRNGRIDFHKFAAWWMKL